MYTIVKSFPTSPMKVKLNLKERIILMSTLTDSRKASIADWKVINEAKNVIGLSDEDYKLYDISKDGDDDYVEGQINWRNAEEGSKEREYEIPNRAYEIVVADLRAIDKKGEFPSADYAMTASKFLEE